MSSNPQQPNVNIGQSATTQSSGAPTSTFSFTPNNNGGTKLQPISSKAPAAAPESSAPSSPALPAFTGFTPGRRNAGAGIVDPNQDRLSSIENFLTELSKRSGE